MTPQQKAERLLEAFRASKMDAVTFSIGAGETMIELDGMFVTETLIPALRKAIAEIDAEGDQVRWVTHEVYEASK